jgi:hypothetical protein
MKQVFFIILVAISFAFAGCSTKTVNTDGIFTIDLSNNYPQKEIHLQGIAGIEYVALETTDDILLDGRCRLSYLSDKYIVVWQSMQGDIFVFNRNGKIAAHMNKKGQGGTEYNSILDLVFDEKNEEIFVVDTRSTFRIQVYSITGDYKRTLKYSEELSSLKAYYFDDEALLIYDDNAARNAFMNFQDTRDRIYDSEKPYLLMSKKDGSIINELNIVLPERYATTFRSSTMTYVLPTLNNMYYGQDFVIADISSDTIYQLSRNKELSPLLIRNPSVHSSGRLTVLSSLMVTDNFLVLRKTVMDDTKSDFDAAFASDTLIYDLKTREINKVSFVNNDFPSGKWFPTVGVQIPQKNTVASLTQLPSLFDAYPEKKLYGELEKLVATLDEEDNPIVTIVKFK